MSLPLPEEIHITVWYAEKDTECKSDYLRVELDLFWGTFSHTRQFGDDIHDKGLVKAQSWASAYQLLNPDLGANTKEIHRPELPKGTSTEEPAS